LYREPHHRAQGDEAFLVGSEFEEIAVDEAADQVDDENDEQDPERGLKQVVQDGALPGGDEGGPAGVDVSQFLLVLDALVEVGDGLLVFGEMTQGGERVLGGLLLGGAVGGRFTLGQAGGFLFDELLLIFLSFDALVEGVVGVGQDRDVIEGRLAGVCEEKA